MIDIRQFICLSDNYGVLVHEPGTDVTISIDAPDAAVVDAELQAAGWSLTHILVTHHHSDHVDGILELKSKYGAQVLAPASEARGIPGVDRTLTDGENFQIGTLQIKAIETPGHTLGQISYYLPAENVVFTGDTLFAMGCGRVFEGTKPQMWASLQRLRELPDDTLVYCGHEYTLANARFAVSIEPRNKALAERLKKVDALRADDKPTLPTTIGLEKATNPFLRADVPDVIAALGMEGRSSAEVFTEIRGRKDRA